MRITMTDSDIPNIMQPYSIELDLETGEMLNPARTLARHASDMRGHYADAAALDALIADGDPLHYEVFDVPVPEEYGQLMYGISTLQPGLVGDECFMTKGHYHTISETAEVYQCLRGTGVMLMKTADGACAWEAMSRGKMVYVPPHWAHRSVNTGSEPLITFYVFPGDAGHNYGDIETEGFPKRIFSRDGEIVIE